MASIEKEQLHELDQLIKTTEFENSVQDKAISAERQKIEIFQKELNARLQEIEKMEREMKDNDKLEKKYTDQVIDHKENYTSLKRTSNVLDEHIEALHRKLQLAYQTTQKQLHMQLQATQKYEPLWESYKKKYESSENAQRISSLKREVATIEKKNEDLESEIKSMEIALIKLKQHNPLENLRSLIVQFATYQVEAKKLSCEAKQLSLTNKSLEHEIKEIKKEITKTDESIKQVKTRKEKKKVSHLIQGSADIEPSVCTSTSSPHHISSPYKRPRLTVVARRPNTTLVSRPNPTVASTTMVTRPRIGAPSVSRPNSGGPTPSLLVSRPNTLSTSTARSSTSNKSPPLVTEPNTITVLPSLANTAISWSLTTQNQPSSLPTSGPMATQYQPPSLPTSGPMATQYQPSSLPTSGPMATQYQPSSLPTSEPMATQYQPSSLPTSGSTTMQYLPINSEPIISQYQTESSSDHNVSTLLPTSTTVAPIQHDTPTSLHVTEINPEVRNTSNDQQDCQLPPITFNESNHTNGINSNDIFALSSSNVQCSTKENHEHQSSFDFLSFGGNTSTLVNNDFNSLFQGLPGSSSSTAQDNTNVFSLFASTPSSNNTFTNQGGGFDVFNFGGMSSTSSDNGGSFSLF